VPPGWKRGSLSLLRRVIRRLSENLLVDVETVSVTASDGTVTLRGHVDGWAQMLVAVSEAFLGGAKRVSNRLRVRGSLSLRRCHPSITDGPRMY
jgi:osmotically-inducible protein OsmY